MAMIPSTEELRHARRTSINSNSQVILIVLVFAILAAFTILILTQFSDFGPVVDFLPGEEDNVLFGLVVAGLVTALFLAIVLLLKPKPGAEKLK